MAKALTPDTDTRQALRQEAARIYAAQYANAIWCAPATVVRYRLFDLVGEELQTVKEALVRRGLASWVVPRG